MSRYLLDTNVVISILNNPHSLPAQRLRQHAPADVYISCIVEYELFYGAFKSQRRAENVALVDALRFDILEFDSQDARQAGAIRADLAMAGQPIGPYDILIAGQAKARNLVLVSHNLAEFRRVPGLQVEDWEV